MGYKYIMDGEKGEWRVGEDRRDKGRRAER